MDRAGKDAQAPRGNLETAEDRRAAPGAADDLSSVTRFYTYRLHKLTTMLNRQMHDELRARYDLGLAEWRTIAVLGEFGELSLRDVARHGATDKAQVSRLLPGLIQRGYVARDAHPTDRRRASLRLTDAGRDLFAEILVLGRRRQAWLVDALTGEERALLVDCLDRLLARIESDPSGPFLDPPQAR